MITKLAATIPLEKKAILIMIPGGLGPIAAIFFALVASGLIWAMEEGMNRWSAWRRLTKALKADGWDGKSQLNASQQEVFNRWYKTLTPKGRKVFRAKIEAVIKKHRKKRAA